MLPYRLLDMGNLQSWEGPITQAYMNRTRDLQHKILAKARSLGMTPLLPAFSSFVPDSFPGETKQTSCCWGGEFPSVSYVEPSGADFAGIMGRYITRYCAEYGCSDMVNYWQTVRAPESFGRSLRVAEYYHHPPITHHLPLF